MVNTIQNLNARQRVNGKLSDWIRVYMQSMIFMLSILMEFSNRKHIEAGKVCSRKIKTVIIVVIQVYHPVFCYFLYLPFRKFSHFHTNCLICTYEFHILIRTFKFIIEIPQRRHTVFKWLFSIFYWTLSQSI